MIKNSLLVGCLCATALLSNPTFAGDAAAGKLKSSMCAGCHGADGISMAPQYPNLAGQKQAYLAKALNDYRQGVRTDPTMNAMAAPLSKDDVANLAAYFAGMKR